MTISTDRFGFLPDGTPVTRFTLRGGTIELDCLDYGGIVSAIRVPDRRGQVANVVLGVATPADYATRSPYFGALIGRFANRIGGARFTLDGQEVRLAANNGPNSLHGGAQGFDKRMWHAAAEADRLVLTRMSPDGEEGYPGTLELRVTYAVTAANEFTIDYEARTDRATVVNLTSHGYFNLAGEGSGSIEGHELALRAASFLATDDGLIPQGPPQPVAGSPFDFRAPRRIGEGLRTAHPQLLAARGYDHCFMLEGGVTATPRPVARLHDPGSGRVMEILTTQPAIQFYSGNFLDGTLAGPSGRIYRQGDALCLETQHAPDSPNRPDFPSTVLRPGEVFRSRTVHRFSLA